MERICVVTIDGSMARIFSLEEMRDPAERPTRALVERKRLTNQWAENLRTAEKKDSRSAQCTAHGGHAGGGAPRSSFTDHDTIEKAEALKHFVKDIEHRVETMVRIQGASRLVIAASPKVLGEVRHHLSVTLRRQVDVHEIAKELSHLSGHELHSYLQREGHLPPRRSAS